MACAVLPLRALRPIGPSSVFHGRLWPPRSPASPPLDAHAISRCVRDLYTAVEKLEKQNSASPEPTRTSPERRCSFPERASTASSRGSPERGSPTRGSPVRNESSRMQDRLSSMEMAQRDVVEQVSPR